MYIGLSPFLILVKSHNLVVKSAHHANDVVVLLFCSFFFLARTIFRESSMKINVKNNYNITKVNCAL